MTIMMEYADAEIDNKVYAKVVRELQEEWQGDSKHAARRLVKYGIRSSQISALIMYLVKKGVLK